VMSKLPKFLLPDPAGLFGQARSASSATGNVLLVLFIGFFVGLNPAANKRAIESIFPHSRCRFASEVIDGMAETLHWWFVGQLFTMLVTTLSIAIAPWFLGMPGSILLGLQEGLMNFIPYLGPVLGAVPITLAVTSQGTSMVIWVLAIYVLIQILEGYVLTPLVQRRAVDVQPALALAAQMLMGVLFGAVGIALATPLLAVARVAVIHLSADEADEH
jgi:predicted PurR-regulated permease PerM